MAEVVIGAAGNALAADTVGLDPDYGGFEAMQRRSRRIAANSAGAASLCAYPNSEVGAQIGDAIYSARDRSRRIAYRVEGHLEALKHDVPVVAIAGDIRRVTRRIEVR
jgi:hypothetical protein